MEILIRSFWLGILRQSFFQVKANLEKDRLHILGWDMPFSVACSSWLWWQNSHHQKICTKQPLTKSILDYNISRSQSTKNWILDDSNKSTENQNLLILDHKTNSWKLSWQIFSILDSWAQNHWTHNFHPFEKHTSVWELWIVARNIAGRAASAAFWERNSKIDSQQHYCLNLK